MEPQARTADLLGFSNAGRAALPCPTCRAALLEPRLLQAQREKRATASGAPYRAGGLRQQVRRVADVLQRTLEGEFAARKEDTRSFRDLSQLRVERLLRGDELGEHRRVLPQVPRRVRVLRCRACADEKHQCGEPSHDTSVTDSAKKCEAPACFVWTPA